MKKVLTLLGIVVGLISVSCSSKPDVNVLEDDLQERFDKGMEYFNRKKYYRAQEEFNTVLIRGSHTELGDDALFYLGESYFYNKEYLLAINEFDRLSRQMIYSPFVEEARFRICESYIELSPKYFHDQENTLRAINKLQEYIEDYPNSVHFDEANQLLGGLRNKLANKWYETGILYIKMEEYESAIQYFTELLSKYYDTDFADISRLKIIEVYLKMGEEDMAKEYLNNNRSKFKDDMLEKAELAISSYKRNLAEE